MFRKANYHIEPFSGPVITILSFLELSTAVCSRLAQTAAPDQELCSSPQRRRGALALRGGVFDGRALSAPSGTAARKPGLLRAFFLE